MFEKLREQTLEDVYNVLCRNEPYKNSKDHREWSYLESIAYEELLIEEERPYECQRIIDEIVTFLKYQKSKEIIKMLGE